MKESCFFRFMGLGLIILLLIATECAAEKPASADPQSGLVLQYRFPRDRALAYKASSDKVQNQKQMGQTLTSTIKGDTNYCIQGAGVDDQNNLITRIVIDSINLTIKKPRGRATPDTSVLSGKSFGVTYSQKGKEIEITGIEELPKIDLGMDGERSVKGFFTDLLPVLPDGAVKPGDTWTTPEDKSVQQDALTFSVKGEATNVFEGLETIRGMECVVIKTRLENTLQGSGMQSGMHLDIKGTVKVIATSYFAYKEGVLVKTTSNASEDIKIDAGIMTVPQKSETKSEIELVF